MRRIVFILVSLFTITASAQEIGGVVNNYYSVSSIGTNSVICDTTVATLSPGDKVLLIQMRGARADTEGPQQPWFKTNGDIDWFGRAEGMYELLAVSDVNYASKQVTFTANFKNTNYDSSQGVQLVRIYETEFATVTSKVTAPEWNGKVGGIVAMVVLKNLYLQDSISVLGKGFRGGESIEHTSGCRPNFDPDTLYFLDGSLNKGGMKGEGILTDTFNYLVGPGALWNGGGGGVGLHGGGGGGAHVGNGGLGTQEDYDCSGLTGIFAEGGEYINYQYTLPRPLFGGGGGGSTYSGALTATDGGNGGGIIFILADTIFGNDNVITASGESILDIASAGAGGAGAGGSILLAVSAYSTNVNVQVNGGDGGETDANRGGPGGGGGGGLVWHAGSSPTGLSAQYGKGFGGGSVVAGYFGEDGGNGLIRDEYVPLLNGFLFNAVTGPDTICQYQQPHKLIGSVPKGVVNYTYSWIYSTDNENWTVIPGTDIKDYQPGPLSDTTYYKRVVTDNDEGIIDSSMTVEILVYPEISGNQIFIRDTICNGIAPGLLHGDPVSGGGGDYHYIWQSKTGISSWNTLSPEAEDYNEERNLTETLYYRRIVQSQKVCADTTEADTMTVIPAITNNVFYLEDGASDTTICNGLESGVILPGSPSGGDGQYRYYWLSSSNGNSYNEMTGENNSSLNSRTLNADIYYKRIVGSGNDNACLDTTTIPRYFDVLPSLSNIDISSDSVRYCAGDIGHLITGEQPSNGAGVGSYNYTWQINKSSGWQTIADSSRISLYPGLLEDSSFYRRIVTSGADDACIDTSNELNVTVVPYTTNLLNTQTGIVCEGSSPLRIYGSPASDGANGFSYSWQSKSLGETAWADTLVNDSSYTPKRIYTTTFYRRLVYTDICTIPSDSIEVTVYQHIDNNLVDGGTVQYNCYATPKTLDGLTPVGGKDAVSYRYLWQRFEGDNDWGNVPDNTSEDFIADTLTVPTSFRRIVYSGDADECIDTSEVVLVNINPLPTGYIVSEFDTACVGRDVAVTYHVEGNGPWTIDLGETAPLNEVDNTTNTQDGTMTFPVDANVNIRVLQIEDDSTCLANLDANDEVFTVKVYEVPVAQAGEDFEICGLNATLAAEPSVGIGTWIYTSATFDNENSPAAQSTVNAYGDHTLTWREENWSECWDEDEVTITHYEQPTEIDADIDEEDSKVNISYQTDIYNLNPLDPTVGYGYWKVSNGPAVISDSSVIQQVVDLPEPQSYSFLWTVHNGVCTDIFDSLVVERNLRQKINGFSPNGDGINEEIVFELPPDGFGKLVIFERNGTIVKEFDQQGSITWDGTNFNGDKLPNGTYLYILYEVGVKKEKGFIELRQ